MTTPLATAGNARQKLVFVELNEVNFDLVRKYLSHHELPSFRTLFDTFQYVETFAEQRYEELEPWIQWVSAHSGKSFAEHGVFRLGDGAGIDFCQIFERLEQSGRKVGAISPMNGRNALARPAYFVPDPWTMTASDGSGFSRRLTAMLRQTVNENSQGRISLASLKTLAEVALRTFTVGDQRALLALIAKAKGRQWIKALVLDRIIHHVHLYLLRRAAPDVSFVFLNAGAHIQHHYYFNSPFADSASRNPDWYVDPKADPILDMIVAYDAMLADHLAMLESGTRLIVATGLTQVPYDRVKFYYRLKSHATFLRSLGIEFKQALPRMTRDFEVLFDNKQAAQAAVRTLTSVRMTKDGTALFGDIQNRGLSVFVTLTYGIEIQRGDTVAYDGGVVDDIHSHVVFVAIKNGMHSSKGFAFFSPGSLHQPPQEPVHVSALFGLTLEACGAAQSEASSASMALAH